MYVGSTAYTRMIWIFYTVLIIATTSTAYSFMTTPGEIITEENCSGRLDYFLCNCLSSNTTIDMLAGNYNFTKQSVCLLKNKTNISITGSTADDTTIECIEPFSIVFMNVQNVTISNIKMIGCGAVVNNAINQTFNKVFDAIYLGKGFRFAVMFFDAINVTINGLTMLNTLGYGITALNMIGEVSVSKLHIENTTFENDPECNEYDYSSDVADYFCSGSGLLFHYYDSINLKGTNTMLVIDQSTFINNKNFLPSKVFNDVIASFETAFYHHSPLPLQGAASIAIAYTQNSFDVNTIISNTFFHNNNGTLSATIALQSYSTIKGKTNITNSVFDDNGRVSNSSYTYGMLFPRGGISLLYLTLRNALPDLPISNSTQLRKAEIFTVMHCNFTKNGGNVGAAIYIQKISTDSVLAFVIIEKCYFTENEGSAGSAVYAINREYRSSSVSNHLIITLVNVHAENNTLSPGATTQYVSSDFITGVFAAWISEMIFDCSELCTFTNNQPSVFFGHTASLAISGKATFLNNRGIYGAGLDLINTVVYIQQGSNLYFANNHATRQGGAIDVFYTATNAQTPVNCPIQFTGTNNTDLIFSLDEINQLNINITFENNTADPSNSFESIYANIYYVCFWYPETLTQINLKLDSLPINGKRDSVYGKMFNIISQGEANEHVYTSAYLPCVCDGNNGYDAQNCMTADINDTLKLEKTVVAGRSFTLNLITLDAVGSVGFSSTLYSQVFSADFTEENFQLAESQNRRSFNAVSKQCTPVDFTIYAKQSKFPKNGILRLTVLPGSDHFFRFNVTDCPVGFQLQSENELFACVCGEFFMMPNINRDFQCDSASGMIVRSDKRSWLSVIEEKIEYIALCSPAYCNDIIETFTLTDNNILCDNNHAGRACGGCIDGYGRIFGSNSCKKCRNGWLATILLFAILGIILVMILYLVRLTVTMGTINGLIFFCNVMSINERLFFNTEDSQFLFLRAFISIINLDLGFEMCFYNEMSQIAKTGLQFVFPVYLWLLIAIIILLGRYHLRVQRFSSYSTVPVLATLILLSYAKLLRAIISVFSFISVHYTTKESGYGHLHTLVAWQPDPNVEYLQGDHIVLFLIALVFMLLFIIPFALAMTFPTIVLRSKRMSRLFPLLDCFYAPYKDKYRYWFGLRLIVLIYLSIMESVILSYQEALLLSGATVLFVFIVLQAYIQPFKNTVINHLDLLFMGLFILLSMITLYLYPSTSGYDEVNYAVNISYIAFFLFCLVVCYHVHTALKYFTWYGKATNTMMTKSKMNDWKISQHLSLSTTASSIDYNSGPYDNFSYLRESFLENL